jgi:hypothetical protein
MVLVGSPSAAGSRPREALMKARMLMKIKQLSEEPQKCADPFPKTKCLKLNRLSILVVGYQGAEK